jgi:type II secretory pathway pseudopilin PulG
MTARARCRRAFTLIEMLVVMAGMALIIGLSIALILGVVRTYDADAALYRRLTAQEQLADRFRADVAAAEAAPVRAGAWSAGERCLILRRPGGRLVVYTFAENAGLERLETGGTATEERQVLPLGTDGVAVAFVRGERDKLLSLRWVETRGMEGAPVLRALEFTAALGGDLR